MTIGWNEADKMQGMQAPAPAVRSLVTDSLGVPPRSMMSGATLIVVQFDMALSTARKACESCIVRMLKTISIARVLSL
jgi:hypothetical protein